jgi:hypothetical protein
MHMIAKLTPEQIAEALAQLPQWTHDPARGAIRRDFVFTDFGEAFALKRRLDHRPGLGAYTAQSTLPGRRCLSARPGCCPAAPAMPSCRHACAADRADQIPDFGACPRR